MTTLQNQDAEPGAKALPVPAQTREFCEAILGDPDPILHFRLIPESKKAKAAGRKPKTFTAPLSEAHPRLDRLNRGGYAAFYLPAETDGRGGKRENVLAARTVVLDLDGASLPDSWVVPPQAIVETSGGRWQVTWSLEPTKDLAAAEGLSRRLAAFYGGDRSAADASHIFRLPGYLHQKAKPFRSRLVVADEFTPPWALDAFSFLPALPPAGPRAAPEVGHVSVTPAIARRLFAVLDARAYADPETWLRLAASLHAASRGNAEVAEQFFAHCRTDSDFDSDEYESENRKRWASFNLDRPGGLTVGTLKHFCRQNLSDAEFRSVFDNAADDFEDDLDDPTVFDTPPTSELANGVREIAGLFVQAASDVTIESIRWLWPGRFAGGNINFIAGHPDQGKSQITCDIAARVSTGAPWPNGEGTAPLGSVVMLSAEDDRATTTVPRLMAAGADLTKIHFVGATVRADDSAKQRMFTLTDDLQKLTRLAKSIPDVTGVIIDPISAYMGSGKGADSYRNTDVRAALAPLAEWAAQKQVAVIFVSHLSKNGSARALGRLTDSLAFGALARCGWMVFPETDENGETGRKLFVRAKNNLAEDKGGLAYRISSRPVQNGIAAPYVDWDGPVSITADEAMDQSPAKPSKLDGAKYFVEEFLAAGPRSSKELAETAERLGHAPETLKRAKHVLGVKAVRDGFGPGAVWTCALPNTDEDFG